MVSWLFIDGIADEMIKPLHGGNHTVFSHVHLFDGKGVQDTDTFQAKSGLTFLGTSLKKRTIRNYHEVCDSPAHLDDCDCLFSIDV